VPGGVKGKSNRPVELLSIYPTLIDLCGLPANPKLEGVSLQPLLENPNADWKHVAISTLGQNNHAVRDERWRYIRYADGSEELYDHQTDPNEWNNLASPPECATTSGVAYQVRLSLFLCQPVV
jgi:arylsulfatase A-like enzyme